ncbi:hypothetical protein M378DRAFT_586007 [Amanita muscaria Koide BX008]|uniref:Uncharacterized protein n=1 Tax=Amanita muscaria (strain Koide BX008) TaxID=946122 RepID=A0A0C2X574_AMAMK|nr:hypothetical protein M378DRAFT_586007 [Amanita muscaria Koide BX008]
MDFLECPFFFYLYLDSAALLQCLCFPMSRAIAVLTKLILGSGYTRLQLPHGAENGIRSWF